MATVSSSNSLATKQGTSTLRQLVNLLNTAVDELEQAAATNSTRLPDLHQHFTPESEAFRKDPIAAEAAKIIGAAALHIEAIVIPPQDALYHIAGGFLKGMALRICLESNVTEILKEAGLNGLHINDICKQNNQDPATLARFLRILATHHVYREVEPDVFSNTRISSMMDTTKPSKEIFADPNHKYDDSEGIGSLVSIHLDEGFKASAYGWEALANPQLRESNPKQYNPWSLGMNTGGSLWDYYNTPEGEMGRRRFAASMKATQKWQPIGGILSTFDWKSLAPDSIVVDVGGNVGMVSMHLVANYPHLRYVIQDLPSVIEGAQKLWDERLPCVVDSGRVTLESHDFFTPQSRTNASVFFLKHILHTCLDEECQKILVHLRRAAQPDTRLLILETVLPYACRDTTNTDEGERPPGWKPREAPSPLLANYGGVEEYPYILDMVMYSFVDSWERTNRQYDHLLLRAGWKLVEIHRRHGTLFQLLEAVPVAIEHEL